MTIHEKSRYRIESNLKSFGCLIERFNIDRATAQNVFLRAILFLLFISVFAGISALQISAQSPLDGFNPDASGKVLAIAVAADGKIYVAGQINSIGGQPVERIARLNADGTLDTSFSATLNNNVFAVALQADGKVLVGGNFTTVNGVSRSYFARLNTNGSLDTGFTATANGSVFAITPRLANENILIGGDFTTINGSARQRLARLGPNGALDPGFSPSFNSTVNSVTQLADGYIVVGGYFWQVNGQARISFARLNNGGTLDTSLDIGANDVIEAMAIQPDRKILIGGHFSSIHGATRNYFARLNADGSLDAGFNPSLDGSIDAITTQPDGKILINGYFSFVNGQPRARLARLNQDGSLDTGFSVSFNSDVETVAVQSNGSILVGGNFSSAGGVTRNRIARFDKTGNLDRDLPTAVTGDVRAIAFGKDDKMIIGGDFVTVDGQQRNRIAKITPAGQLDPSYNPDSNGMIKGIVAEENDDAVVVGNFTTIGGLARSGISKLKSDGTSDSNFSANTNLPVNAVVKQHDGKYVIGGEFTQVGTESVNRVARLNPNGSVDTSFNPNVNGKINVVKKQNDGKIIIGGEFTTVGGAPAQRIARLNTDGSLDTSFTASVNGPVKTIGIQPDGKIVVGGAFSDASLAPRTNIARLNINGSIDSSYNPTIDGEVEVITVRSDGKLIVGGGFSNVNNEVKPNLVYLNTNGTTDQTGPPARTSNTLYAATVKSDKANFGAGGGNSENTVTRELNRDAAIQGLIAFSSRFKLTSSGSSALVQSVALETSVDNGLTWVARGRASALIIHSSLTSGENAFTVNEPAGVEYDFTGLNLPTSQNLLVRISGTDENSGSYEEQIFSAFIDPPVAQTITVTTAAPAAAYIGSKFNVAATASSGLPVAITTSGNCSVFSGGTNGSAVIQMGGALTDCTVNYDQAGDGAYDPAPTVSNLTTAAACPIISTASPTTLTNVPITIPVNTSALSNAISPSIFAATFTYTFDPAVLQFVSATPGAAAPSATILSNQTSSGTVAVSLSNSAALNGTGSLVDLNFNVIGAIGSSSALTVTSFQFNEANTLAVCSTISSPGILSVVSGTITGNVNFANGAPQAVSGVTITANGSPVVSDVSDALGNYSLSNFGAGAYTVTASKPNQIDPSNGFTPLDASSIAQHVVGLITLSGNPATAADVTEDGTISSLDAAFVAQFIVGISNVNNHTGEWRFTPASTSPDTTIDSLQNYAALLLGDVNGSWSNTGAARPAPLRMQKTVKSSLPDLEARTNAIITIPLRIDASKEQDVLAYQFEIAYNPAVVEPDDIAATLSGTVSQSQVVFSNAPVPGRLRVVVFGAFPVRGDGVYVNLRFIAIGEAGAKTTLSIKQMMINDGAIPVDVSDGKLTLTSSSEKGDLAGRLITAFGKEIENARILLTSSTGEQLAVNTTSEGRFRFTGLRIGETYSISVRSNNHRIAPLSVSITGDQAEIEMVDQE